jgi:hypothetical protein
MGALRGGGGGFPRGNFVEPLVGESALAGMAGTGRDSVCGFTGELVRAGIRGDGRDGGAGGLPARIGGGNLRGGGGGVDESPPVLSSRGFGAGVVGFGGLTTAGLGGTTLAGSDGADDGTAGGRPKLLSLAGR